MFNAVNCGCNWPTTKMSAMGTLLPALAVQEMMLPSEEKGGENRPSYISRWPKAEQSVSNT